MATQPPPSPPYSCPSPVATERVQQSIRSNNLTNYPGLLLLLNFLSFKSFSSSWCCKWEISIFWVWKFHRYSPPYLTFPFSVPLLLLLLLKRRGCNTLSSETISSSFPSFSSYISSLSFSSSLLSCCICRSSSREFINNLTFCLSPSPLPPFSPQFFSYFSSPSSSSFFCYS